jgi:hypothetical protein
MRLIVLGLLASLAAVSAAHADPAADAAAAVGACLSAVIDGAPVADKADEEVAIHRETDPNLCLVQVVAGDPAEVRRAVMDVIARRPEGFKPAKSAWDPGDYASREALCNAPGRRALNVVVETGKPGALVTLMATVVEGDSRDRRCDVDLGVQHP